MSCSCPILFSKVNFIKCIQAMLTIFPWLKLLAVTSLSHSHMASTAGKQKSFPFVDILNIDFFFLESESEVTNQGRLCGTRRTALLT